MLSIATAPTLLFSFPTSALATEKDLALRSQELDLATVTAEAPTDQQMLARELLAVHLLQLNYLKEI